MDKILTEWRKYLTESGLSRIHQHITEHDCAIFSGFRGDIQDTSACTDKAISPDEGDTNMNRNREIKAILEAYKDDDGNHVYGVTKVDGAWIEDYGLPSAKEEKEKSLFAVNLGDDPNFVDMILDLGERYCQDAVLIIPKGGKGVYLMGTNNAEFPSYGKKIDQGSVSFGDEGAEFMTRVKGRPFSASPDEEDLTEELETYKTLSRWGRMAVNGIAASYRKKIKNKK